MPYADDLDLGHALADAADAITRDRFHASDLVVESKPDLTPVSDADRAVEQAIRALLRERRPGDAVSGEEFGASGTGARRWVIDPIDGTVNFLYGLPQYAVSIAAEWRGEVVAGVVVNAATGVEYVAHVSTDGTAEATRDGRPIGVRGPAPLSQRLVATGFSYDASLRELQAEALVRLLPRVRDIRRLGSCALDLCHVAEGSIDAYVEEGVNLWDHAAGALVARAAGARTELTRGVGGRDLLVCAPSHGFDEFRDAVQQAGYAARKPPEIGE